MKPICQVVATIPQSLLDPLIERYTAYDWNHPYCSRPGFVAGWGKMLDFNVETTPVLEDDDFTQLFEHCFPGKFDRIYRAKIINLPPDRDVAWHIDDFQYHYDAWRYHIPLTTNDGCRLRIVVNDAEDVEDFFMEVGKAYVFDNNRKHMVYNHGSTERLHFIIDILQEGVPIDLGQLRKRLGPYPDGNRPPKGA